MLLLVQYTLIFTSVLLLVALGGCFSEHSGVINLGLEGIMVIGALGGALVMRFVNVTGFSLIMLTLLAAAAAGMLYSCLLAVASINFKADQTIVGTAMNMLGTAAATVLVKAINKLRKLEEERKAAAAPAPEPEAPTTKICPFCKSEIPIDAVRCPHCTSELPAEG